MCTVTDMRSRRLLTFVVLPVAVLLQLIVLVPFTVASGLLAPLGGVVVLHVVWAVATTALVLLLRRRSWYALFVPLVNASIWWATMTLGDIWLGWTA